MRTPARCAALMAAKAPSRLAASRRFPSSLVKRSMRVVRAKLAQLASTESVETRATLFALIVATIASSSSMPCSIESTPASAPTRAPSRMVAWAVIFRPRPCTASHALRTSSTVNGQRSERSGGSSMILTKSVPESSWANAAARSPSPSLTGTVIGRYPSVAIQVPATRI